jgi:hypothetical protein
VSESERERVLLCNDYNTIARYLMIVTDR